LEQNPATNTQQINAYELNKRSKDAIVVFGPKDVWPLMIRFTLRKYDETLKVTGNETYMDGSNAKAYTHGGQTLEYVFKLPAKN
jgi:hypothetical protein